MLTAFLWLMYASLAVVGVWSLTFGAQVLWAPRRHPLDGGPPTGRAWRVAVLVPAHNEAAVIATTLAGLLPQLRPGDRLLVVADNCTDDTAALARAAGAEVVERSHATERGKGYALDFGVRHLAQNPPEVLLIVDADCWVQPGSLHTLSHLAGTHGRPVQALYLMNAPEGAPLKQRVAAWAWRVKNWVRPLGWHRMGWPCQLMGTGMAFPWAMAERMALANGHLVEDMKLGADLALAGTPPLFCPQALVTSEFPTATAAQQSQRKRWEHGHLSMLFSLGPRVLWQGIRRGHMPTVAMALDLLVPPVALLGLLLALLWCGTLTLALWAGGAYLGPWALANCLIVLFMLALCRAWWGWGRDLVSATEAMKLPWLLLGKVPLYVGFVFRRQRAWVRTERK
ncbi:glycosyltransferase family 2 protein [Aquabacterium sp. A08]|uniref:glycosyltransferase family 2 protein n=1 Tax=Aquabacterium sp. A08 TaxID=2718532 RepID=UPI00141E5FFC|nr:glycosyltransferase family 2 protein [Aquabacterium sp. A08]NIC41044.1 glycosyltransferase family 2 protein [Aquabacterium sp. A08]